MINKELKQKLNRFTQKYYLNKLTRGSMYAVGLSLVYTLFVSLTEYYGHFNGNVRLALLIVLILGLGAIAINYLFIPLFGLLKLGKHLSYHEAARLIGKHFPEIDDRIVNTLELGEMSSSDNSLVFASIEQKLGGFNAIPFNRAINLKENLKYWPVLVIPVLVFVILGVTGQFEIISEGSKRIVEYNKEFKEETPFSFILLNNNLKGEEGESFTVRFGFEGASLPQSAEFVSENGRGRFVRGGDNSFEFNINNLKEDVQFHVEANGFSSPVYDLRVIPVPRIRSLIMRVEPPTYTGLKSFVSPSKSVLDVPEGSKLFWDANTKSTNKMSIQTADTIYPMNMDGEGAFSTELKVTQSFDYKIINSNKIVTKESGESKQINVLKDAFPEVESFMELDSNYSNTVFYRGQISDDYGFTRLKLMAEWNGKARELQRIQIPAGSAQYSFSGLLRLDSLVGKQSGARLFLKVWDNDGVNGAKASSSRKMEVALKTKEQQKEELAEQYEEYFSNKEELNEKSEEIKKELERLRNKLQNQKKADWKDKERLREMLEEQKKLLQEQKKLEKENDKLRDKEEELKPKSEEIKEKEEKIEELKNDPKKEELEKLLDEISKLMEKIDMDKLTQKLEEMERMSEQNQRREERIDKLLKELEFQKDVLEQTEKLQELADKMDELSKEEKIPEEELKEQNEVKEEFEKVKEELEKLQEENQKFDEKMEEQNAEENEQKADDSMEQSEQSLEKNQQQQANDQQKESSEQMKEMSEKMMQSLMSMGADQKQEDMATLRQILENLEILSFDIEDLSALSKESKASDPMFKRLLVDQKRLQDGAKIIEDSLVALGERVPEIKEIVYDELEDIEVYLDNSIQSLEERRGAQSAGHQQYVMTAANNLALLLDDALRNMQQQMASQKKGSQNCQKPGSGKPSMSNMKKLQSELGKQMQQMKQGQKPGKGDKKGEKGDSKEIVEMLSRQEQLRRQLEEFSEKEGENGSKGNLQKAIEEMKELEKDLLDGEISLESLERVKEIESRLLESEKATLEQQQDEKRESKSAKDKEQEDKEILDQYLKDRQNEIENLYFAPLNMQKYYKSQSNNYINKL